MTDNIRSRMTALAVTFPTLEAAPGVDPWDPAALDTWATGGNPGSGARHAAHFLLSVWDPQRRWKSRGLHLHAALQTWDAAHRRAWQAWAAAPWWP